MKITLFLRLTKYETLNVLRSRWILFYSAALALMSFVFLYLAGDPEKALVTVATVVTVLVPLVAVLFSSFSWYNSERLTELLTVQPIRRGWIFLARFFALTATLTGGFLIGVGLPFVLRGAWIPQVPWVLALGCYLSVAFVSLGLMIGSSVQDRMRGVGLSFALWFYFVLVHDLVLMVVLILLKDYPLDFAASVAAAVNPIGLSRVMSLVLLDAPMLLGHAGALVREVLLGWRGQALAVAIVVFWAVAPALIGGRIFSRRDL